MKMSNDLISIKDFILKFKGWWAASLGIVIALILGILIGIFVVEGKIINDCKFLTPYLMVKAWVLILVLNGVTNDLGPKMTAPDCQAAWKKYTQQHPKQKYNTFCEWRNP